MSLDALGTLVALDPPWVHLAHALGTEADERLVRAVRAEMSYYRDHSHLGRDADSLAELRRRCARLLSDELGREVDVETMMASIRFRPFDDAIPALDSLDSLGVRLVCVSNWDCSLGDVLAACGLADRLDAVITSAEVGVRKPDPAIFEHAAELLGCQPRDMMHVGDTPEEDLAGARAAGMSALLIDRSGGADIASLDELAGRLASMPGE